MGINFETLPTESPSMAVAKDVYLGLVKDATMKTPKTKDGEPEKLAYLNLTFELKNGKGVKVGTLNDMLFDNDNPNNLYKIGRFVAAIGLPLTGTMELKDIAKISVNKEVAVDCKPKTEKYTKDGEEVVIEKTVTDVFSGEIYYKKEDFAARYEALHPDEKVVYAEQLKAAMDLPKSVDGTDTPDEVAY